MEPGTRVKIVGNGGSFEGWYGVVIGLNNGLYSVRLTHDDQCKPKPPFDLQGLLVDHLQPGQC